MTKALKPWTRLGLPALALALAAAGAATGPGGSAEAEALGNGQPVRCEIAVSRRGHATTYQGRVQAVRAVAGSYTFNLVQRSGGGQSVISQGGEFTLRPGEVEVLGEASFGGTGHRVDAELTLLIDGKTLNCVLDDTI